MRSTATSPSSFDRENAPSASAGPVGPQPRFQAAPSEPRSPARRGRGSGGGRARGAPHEPERILDVDSVSLGENPLGLLDDDAAVERLLQLGRASREHACQLEQAACDTRASRLHSRVMWPMKRSRSSGSAFAPDSSACAAPTMPVSGVKSSCATFAMNSCCGNLWRRRKCLDGRRGARPCSQ